MNTKFKTIICALTLAVFFTQNVHSAIADSKVTNWKDDKQAAFLLMFDDGMPSAYQVAIPELLKRKMIATFYVCPGSSSWTASAESKNQWENLIPKTGMAYGDHTWTHKGAADLEIEDREIRLAQEKIHSIFYNDGKKHLISYGQPGVDVWFDWGAGLTAILNKYYLISRPDFAGHGAVYHWQTAEQMLALADKAIISKGREYLVIHGVERRVSEGDPNFGYQDFWPLDKDIFRAVLDGLAQRRDEGKLWITDHISQYKYQMERDSKPVFETKFTSETEVRLTMTCTLDRELFDLPLTVITEVPGNWISAVVTQGNKVTKVPVNYGRVMYDAMPNGELITLVKNDDPTAPTGTASTVYLVQPGGSSGASWSGVTGTVVDLTTLGQSLNEWYKTVSFNVGDEIWLTKGTYVLTDSIVTQTEEKIYGGFTGTEQTISARLKGTKSWEYTNETIIDGNNSVRGIVSLTGATIDGITVQNCAYSSTTAGNCAAAVKLSNNSIMQNCIVKNNTITGQTTGNYSGGVYVASGGKLINSYIHHNNCANTQGGGNGGGATIYQSGLIDGCTITENTAYRAGGGVNIIARTGGSVLTNSIISNNTATNGGGGGVNLTNGGYVDFASGKNVSISNCTISSNSAKTDGGGMYLDVPNVNYSGWNSNPVSVTNCIITSNLSLANGGGLYLYEGQYTISGCAINNNESRNPTANENNGGGAIFTKNSPGSYLTLNNSTIKGNVSKAGTKGSAIRNDMGDLRLNNCLITGNVGDNFLQQGTSRKCYFQNCTVAANTTSTGLEAGMYLGWTVTAISTFTNCLFYKSSANPIGGYWTDATKYPTVTYCGFEFTTFPTNYANKTGCLTGLTPAAFTDAVNGDWTLATASPAIDAGTTIAAITNDLVGTTRPQGTAYDMGAYEKNTQINSNINIKDIFQCHVENNSLIFRGLPIKSKLKIFNISGVLITEKLIDSPDFSILLTSGYYVASITTKGMNYTQKVIID